MTTLELPAAEVWRFYNSRAESENRIKELKEDFGADGFCLQSFDGTDAVFRLICCLYNLMAEFKRDILHDPTRRLLTLRHEVLVVGAILGAMGRTPVLRLGLRGHWRARFARLLKRINAHLVQLWRSWILWPSINSLDPRDPGNRGVLRRCGSH